MKKFKITPLMGVIPLFLISAAITFSNSSNIIYHNLAYLNLAKALVSDQIKAEDRQARLHDFINSPFYPQSGNISPPSVDEYSEISMLNAIFIGEYYRFQGNWDKAAQWYLVAIESDPFPVWQNSLSYLRKDKLLPDGTYKDDLSNTNRWILDPSSNIEELVFENSGGILNISFENIPNRRDKLAYVVSTGLFNLGYHRLLSIRMKLEPGTFFTLSAKTDDELERYISYYMGSGEWETIKVPLKGDVIHYLRMSFSETGKPNLSDSYQAQIDWIHIEPLVE